MKLAGKILLYLLLFMGAVYFFGRFQKDFGRDDAASRRFEMAEIGREGGEGTNEVPAEPVTAQGSELEGTNAVATGTGTNAAAGGTNVVKVAGTNLPSASSAGQLKPAAKGRSGAGLSLAGFVAMLLGLAGMVGWDVTQWFARKSAQGLGVDVRPIENNPEYDAAEAEWAKGNHMDAIKMLREFLERNPSQQHAAIRIAEIYEKDLGNYLAAALELEEVLTKRLPREKWGWTAIHLANLYSGRLNQADKALATLQRIVNEYPDTSAAKKARQRLGIAEPVDLPAGEMAADGLAQAEGAPGETEPENPSMPKGFKPRKK